MSAALIDQTELGHEVHRSLVRTGEPARSATILQFPARPVARSVGWHLTERGLAVIVGFFLGLFAVATIVLVSSFLAVSNEPPANSVPASKMAPLQG